MPTPDPVRRQAARTATLVAIPVALAVAAIGLWRSGVFESASPPAPTTPAPTSVTPLAPVPMAAPQLSDADVTVCRAVIAKLPDKVLTKTRRPVTAGAEQNAAFGEPPMTVACGATQATYA